APLPEGVQLIKGDRHNPQDISGLRSLGFEALVDINAYTREETQTVINAFEGALTRFVHLSTVAVCQRASGVPINESDPLVTDPNAGYAYGKAECERALRWAHARSLFPFVILRPTAVYGPRDRISRENYYLKRLIAGDPVIVPDSGAAPIFAIYVKDLAEVIANALTARGVEGLSYHLSQPELVSVNEHVTNIARFAEVEANLVNIPSRLLARLGFNLDHLPYYCNDQLIVCDTQAAARDLDFAPTPYLRALRETIEYFLDRDPEHCPSFGDGGANVIPRSRERVLADRYRAAMREIEDRLTEQWLSEGLPAS
ncbi:MAG TPA: NAD-dependent epimerase/dehydratase family protein, partial [Blastocatellia bacterium]|nr:NAD-dependent epimerase/dehydratase family protein [Blastocatellia bacterium]